MSFQTRRVIRTWQLPMPASADMGGVSADGRTLLLSGRYNAVVYAINTRTGHLRATIPVGDGPHGLCVWPQPWTYPHRNPALTRSEAREAAALSTRQPVLSVFSLLLEGPVDPGPKTGRLWPAR